MEKTLCYIIMKSVYRDVSDINDVELERKLVICRFSTGEEINLRAITQSVQNNVVIKNMSEWKL